jgi:putative SOS response-associated peptidase YedK
LAAIHDRMPVMIEPSGFSRWLDPAVLVDTGFDARLAVDLLTAYPVSTAVNSVRNNSVDLLAPIPAESASDELS